MPPNWEPIEPGQDIYEAQLERLRAHNPDAARGLDEQLSKLMASDTVFFAADMSTPAMEAGLPGTVSVDKRQLPEGMKLRDYVESNVRSLNRQQKLEKPVSCELRGIGTSVLGVVRFRGVAAQNDGSMVPSYTAVYIAARG